MLMMIRFILLFLFQVERRLKALYG